MDPTARAVHTDRHTAGEPDLFFWTVFLRSHASYTVLNLGRSQKRRHEKKPVPCRTNLDRHCH